MSIREEQVSKLLAARQAYDEGRGTAGELLDVVQASTGYEISEAMDRYGQGTESWARIAPQ
jgi:hypothetical protein